MLNFTNRLIKYHNRRYLCLLLIVPFVFEACRPTPWPQNFKHDLEQTYRDNPSHIMNFFVQNGNLPVLASCVLRQAKIDYPNYKDFQEEDPLKLQSYIEETTISCLNNEFPKFSFDDLIEAVKKNEHFEHNSKGLSRQEINEYTRIFKSELESRFSTMQNFLVLSVSKEIDLMQVFDDIDTKCGEIIMSQRTEKKNELDKLNSLITYENGLGRITFENITGFRVFDIKLVYYLNSNVWSGWVSEGHWELQNGEKKTISIPLSMDGSIGHKIYYTATMYDSEDRLVTWNGGKGNFITARKIYKYRVPNAQSLEVLKLNDDFYLSKDFQEIDFGERYYDSYSIGFTYGNK